MEHPGLISSYDSEKKSLSLPIHKSASEGLIHYGHHSHSSTPPPGTVNKGGKVSMQGGIPVLVNSNPQARAVVIWCTFTCTCTTSKLLVHFHIKGRHMGKHVSRTLAYIKRQRCLNAFVITLVCLLYGATAVTVPTYTMYHVQCSLCLHWSLTYMYITLCYYFYSPLGHPLLSFHTTDIWKGRES